MQQLKKDLFESPLPAIGHGVNVHGVMGAGIAVGFRKKFPKNYKAYKEACANKTLVPGSTFAFSENDQFILNIASQDKPGANARDEWLESALHEALAFCDNMIESDSPQIGLPLIGGGIGGLDMDEVVDVMENVESFYETEIFLHVL